MKFAVHWAPSVYVMTPGWTAAEEAGAQADAAAGDSTAAARTAAQANSVRRCMNSPKFVCRGRCRVSAPASRRPPTRPESCQVRPDLKPGSAQRGGHRAAALALVLVRRDRRV